MPTTFSIVTTGYPTTESSEKQTLEHLTALLKNERQARMLLSGTRRAIKSRLSESAAMKYFQAFSSAGLMVKIEPEPDTPVVAHDRQAADPSSLGPDPKQMLARVEMAVKQTDKQLDNDVGLWIWMLISIAIVIGVAALMMKQMAWYWAIGLGLVAASIPLYCTGVRMEKNEAKALNRFLGFLTSGADASPEWVAFVQACLRHKKIRFTSTFCETLPKQIAAWCKTHGSPEVEAILPGFEAFLAGDRKKQLPITPQPVADSSPEAIAEAAPTPKVKTPSPLTTAGQTKESTCEKLTAVNRNMAASSPSPTAPKSTKKQTARPANRPVKQHSAKRSKKKKQPQQKTIVDSGLGLLGNLIGLVVGGAVFGLVSALLASLTGSETLALIVATPLGLGAWRMTAEAIH